MLLTFIITTYNLRPSEIRRCLSSLLRQNVSTDDFEVLVVDDGSAESPQPVVNEFMGQMNVRFFSQEHARQGAARNLAFRHALGDYIQIVDGDDYLFVGSARRILTIIEENDLDMLIYDFSPTASTARIDSCPHVATRTDFYRGCDYMRSHTLFGSSCTMCFRRSLLALGSDRPILFPEGISIEDEDFVTRLVWNTSRLGVTDLVAYAYIVRDNSTTHSRTAAQVEQRFTDTFTVLDRLIAFRQEAMEASPTGASPTPPEGGATEPAAIECATATATAGATATATATVPGVSTPGVSGLDRKLHFLALDILRHTLREPDWATRFPACADQLRTRSLDGVPLFPLPRASWSTSYRLFRILFTKKSGLRILRWYEQAQEGPKGHMPSFGGTMKDAYRRFRIYLHRTIGKKAGPKAKAFFRKTTTTLKRTTAGIVPFFKKTTAGIAPFFKKTTAGIAPFFKKATAGIAPFFKRTTAGIAPFFKKATASIAPFFKKATAGIVPFFKKATAGIVPFFKKVGERCVALYHAALQKCRVFLDTVREQWLPAAARFGQQCLDEVRTLIARLTHKDD